MMKKISKIRLSGEPYEIVDTEARVHISSISNPHSVTKEQVGLGNVDNVKQYSSSNPPPYPVISVNGHTGVVTLSKGDIELDKVGNFKAVSTEALQGLTDTEKDNARANIGAGTSNFSGNYNDLTKPSTGIPKTDLALAVQSGLHTVTETDVGIPIITYIDNTIIGANVDTSGRTLATTSDVVNKYTKPFTGIPKADLSSEVQTSLGKADKALQSVPNTYRTSVAQDTIDASKMPLVLGDLNGNHTITDSDYIPLAGAPDYDAEKVNVYSLKAYMNADRQAKITASGILKGNGSGGVSAAVAGTDYQAPIIFGKNSEHEIITLNGKDIAATSDRDGNYISSTYATKTEMNGKQDALGFTPENAANKATSISSSSTDTQYPSAKAVHTSLEKAKAKARTVTIAVADWAGGTTCTIEVADVQHDSIVIVDTSDGNVECTAQGRETLTFTAKSTPTSVVTAKVVIL